MILSDVSIRSAIEIGRIVIDPFDTTMVQPSSVDVRVDRYFRVFENHRYPFIDPKSAQPERTQEVETTGDAPFMRHPGELLS